MSQTDKIFESEAFRAAKAYIENDRAHTLEQQVELAQIPAHSNHEERKAARIAEMIKEAGYNEVITDEVNNVYTIIRGTKGNPRVMITAHSDTVFPLDTDLTVRRTQDGRIYCPGICDDTRGVAEILSMLRAMKACRIQPVGDIIIGSDVGEENEGKMRGIKHLCKTVPNIDGYISIDLQGGAGTMVYAGTGSYRYKITFKGVGGHSFTAFGTPNPAYAMGRAIAAMSTMTVPKTPRTTYNVGVVSGGTAATAIPKEVYMCIDLRSNGVGEMEQLKRKVEAIIKTAVEAENNYWNSEDKVTYEIELLGELPVAPQKDDHAIVQAGLRSMELLGIEYKPRPEGAGPTDSNIAILNHIPAITLGRGGKGGGGHSLDEWFEPKDEHLGPQRALLTLLTLSGVDGVSEPVL